MALHAMIAASGFVVASALSAASEWLFGTSVSAVSDVKLYFDYANLILQGRIPYRDFFTEYPPGSIAFLVGPRLASASLAGYAALFALQMLLVESAAVFLAGRAVRRECGDIEARNRLVWYSFCVGALSPFAFTHYDMVPATVAFCATIAWREGRGVIGGGLAAVGSAIKLFPGLCALPYVFVRLRNRKRSSSDILAFLVACLAWVGTWYVLAPNGVRYLLRYHAERGLEIESLYAGLLMAVGKVLGSKGMAFSYDHGSFQLVMAGCAKVAGVTFPLQVVVIVSILWLFRKSDMGDEVRYVTALILAFIICGKVLSPQYLIWLIPFAASLRHGRWRQIRVAFACSCILTTVVYPFAFPALLSMRLWAAPRRERPECPAGLDSRGLGSRPASVARFSLRRVGQHTVDRVHPRGSGRFRGDPDLRVQPRIG